MADSIAKFAAAKAKAAKENTLAAPNRDVNLSKAPARYFPSGRFLPKNEANSRPNKTAQRLGSLFEHLLPSIIELAIVYGTRVSEISSTFSGGRAPTDESTDIWGITTYSGAAIAVHLLAFILARLFDSQEAISIWLEIIRKRRELLMGNLGTDSEQTIARDLVASELEISRAELANWDSSARIWLQHADKVKQQEHRQIMLILDWVKAPSSNTYTSIMRAWTTALDVMNHLAQGVPQQFHDTTVLFAISSWHLYPDMYIHGDENGYLKQRDPLFSRTATLTLRAAPAVALDQVVNVGPSSVLDSVAAGDFELTCLLLTERFDLVATGDLSWLLELRSLSTPREMAAIMIDDRNDCPWVYVVERDGYFRWLELSHLVDDEPNPSIDFHQGSCIHSGGEEASGIYAPGPTNVDYNYNISELMGIAGVYPYAPDESSGISPAMLGSVIFDGIPTNSTASVSYDFGHTGSNSLEVRCRDILARSCKALRLFLCVVKLLQQDGTYCDSYTILRADHKSSVIELTRMEFKLAISLYEAMELVLESQCSVEKCLDAAWQVLEKLNAREHESNNNSLVVLSHMCALAVQALCLGLSSYCQGHTRPFRQSFLRYPLISINLMGSNSAYMGLHVSLHELSCMGEMLGDRVVVFGTANPKGFDPSRVYTPSDYPLWTSAGSFAKNSKYDIFGKTDDIVDTWGMSQLLLDLNPTNGRFIRAVEIEGGVIVPRSGSRGNVREELKNPLFHWKRGQATEDDMWVSFSPLTKLRIGAASTNLDCPVNCAKVWTQLISSGLIDPLGTSSESWELGEQQIGIQGGQYIVVRFNKTYKKRPGVSLKQYYLNLPRDVICLPFLESPWGLQVSMCTGVARRVVLRELLGDVMTSFVAASCPSPRGWDELLNTYKIIEAFKSSDIKTWLSNLPSELQSLAIQTVHNILDVLRHTGIDSTGENLILSWVHYEDPFRCLKIPCRKENFWAKIFADSEDCATFACITSQCLETEDHTCRGLPAPPWATQSVF